MAEAKWTGVLSTTEPRNDVGIIKVRQGNINSEIVEFQIVKNNKPYDLTGLTVYFCASFGLNLVEKPAVVVNTTGGKIQYTFDDDSMQAVGRQKGYFSIKKEESKVDSTQDFEFQVDSSLMTRSIDGKSYIYKLSTLIKVLDDFVKNGQNNFNVWFESVKEILYGVDPGGNILRELIEARKNSSGNIFASLKARLDKNEDETNRQLAQTAYIIIDIQDLINVVNTTEERTVLIGGSLDLATDLYVPKNIRLLFRNNGKINVASAVTLTIDGYVDAGHYQIFSFADETAIVTTTNIGSFGETSVPTNIKYNIKLAWFGAKGDATPPLGTLIGTNLPTGTDDTKAIKRAVDFANKASINGTLNFLKNPMVTVEAQPNATYFVRGNNILGVQNTDYTSVCYRFEGNGSQYLHQVQSETDSFIDNGYLMMFPSFEDLSVDVYINNGSKRLGNFFNLNGEGKPVIKMFRPGFERVRVGANSAEYGYKSIYKIDGRTMADNGSVTEGYYGSFEKFFNCSNPEAVNWGFENNYLHPTTDNGCVYYMNYR